MVKIITIFSILFLLISGNLFADSQEIYIYEQGYYLLHPTSLYYKAEKVIPFIHAYTSQKADKRYRTHFYFKKEFKEEKIPNGIRLFRENKIKGDSGTENRILTPDGLSLEYHLKTTSELPQGSFGEIHFLISEEFLKGESQKLTVLGPNGEKLDFSAESKSKIAISARTLQGKGGKFTIKGEKKELIIDIKDINITGDGACYIALKQVPASSVFHAKFNSCLRLIISFRVEKPMDIKVVFFLQVKEL